jgi:hypothetical protein
VAGTGFEEGFTLSNLPRDPSVVTRHMSSVTPAPPFLNRECVHAKIRRFLLANG